MRKVSYIDDFEHWKSEFDFSIRIDVRFSEVDMFGHMNNVATFDYFEEARIKYMAHIGLFKDLSGDELPVVGDLQCDYHKQVYFGETLYIYVKAQSVGNSSLDLHYLGINEQGDVCITGRGVIINMNKKTGKSAPLSTEHREAILTAVK